MKASHYQDGFKNHAEESKEDKSFYLGAPQTHTSVPDWETCGMSWAGHTPGAFPGRRLYYHTRCTQVVRMLWVPATVHISLLMTIGSCSTCGESITSWDTVN